MQHAHTVSEYEVAAAFPKTKIAATWFGLRLLAILERAGYARRNIDHPDLADADEHVRIGC